MVGKEIFKPGRQSRYSCRWDSECETGVGRVQAKLWFTRLDHVLFGFFNCCLLRLYCTELTYDVNTYLGKTGTVCIFMVLHYRA